MYLQNKFEKNNKGEFMYYVYLQGFYGTELIGSSESLEEAQKIKAEQDAKWEPGFMWDTKLTTTKQKETNYYD
jgi:hypothetical protein